MVSAPIHGYARRLASLLSLAFLSTALWLTSAGPTFACSCAQPEPMAAYATADYAIFAGTAGPSDARGVPVRVAQWFSGKGAAPLVYLSAQSFTGEASCGISLPPAGTNWIWVTFLADGGRDPSTGLCNPHGQLGTPEGDALLAEATRDLRRHRPARSGCDRPAGCGAGISRRPRGRRWPDRGGHRGACARASPGRRPLRPAATPPGREPRPRGWRASPRTARRCCRRRRCRSSRRQDVTAVPASSASRRGAA